MVKDVVDGAAAEKLVRERGLVGAGVEGDPLRGSLQVALERDARARLGGVVVKADVTAEGLAEIDVPETEVPLQMQRATTEVQCTHPKLCGSTSVCPRQSSSIPCKELESLRSSALSASFGRSRADGSDVTTSGTAKVGRVRRITESIRESSASGAFWLSKSTPTRRAHSWHVSIAFLKKFKISFMPVPSLG